MDIPEQIKIEAIKEALRNSPTCPVEVELENFHKIKTREKGAARLHFDFRVVQYLKEPGKIPEGEVLKHRRWDDYFWSKKNIASGVNPFAKKGRKKGKESLRPREAITTKSINDICIRENLDYRLHSYKVVNGIKRGVFWHPEFGYSDSMIPLNQWKARISNPFKSNQLDKEQITKVTLTIRDNDLENIYEIDSNEILKDKNNLRRIKILCKIHLHRDYCDVNTLLNKLSFNCPGCRKKDFWGLRRLRQLELNPALDKGTCIVYFVKLNINGMTTLKFGITQFKSGTETERSAIERRYKKPGEKILAILNLKTCDTELIARQHERRMLTNTIQYIDTSIEKHFGGYSECRVDSDPSKAVCSRIFEETIAQEY